MLTTFFADEFNDQGSYFLTYLQECSQCTSVPISIVFSSATNSLASRSLLASRPADIVAFASSSPWLCEDYLTSWGIIISNNTTILSFIRTISGWAAVTIIKSGIALPGLSDALFPGRSAYYHTSASRCMLKSSTNEFWTQKLLITSLLFQLHKINRWNWNLLMKMCFLKIKVFHCGKSKVICPHIEVQ